MGHDLPPDHARRPGLCQLPRGRRRRGRSPRSSIRAWTSTSTCAWRATWARASSTCSRPTTTPTTSPATGAWPPPPARPSTSTARRRPSTTTSPSTTAGSSRSARSWCAPLHTPGHRPEHTAFALIDTERGPEPWAVLTGDSLFVGGIARPDLAVDPREGAHGIFHSLHERLLTLPDTCEVWPGHLGGSMCGGPGIDLKVSSTIGYERAHQEVLGGRRRGGVRRARGRRAGPAAAELPRHRGHQHRPADPRRGAVRSAHAAPGRAAPARRRAAWSTSAPSCSSTTRTSPARSASPCCARASARGWRGSPTTSGRWSSSAATTTTRARAIGLAGLGRRHQRRRLPRRRDDELARGPAPGRRASRA